VLSDAIELRSLLEPMVERLGYELVHVTLTGSKTKAFRMFIDAPGGITVDDCERVSRRVSDVLDVEEMVEGEYTLEVSSPGLDRPLVKQEHFEQAQGKNVSIRMQNLHLGRRKFRGSLLEVRSDAVLVEVDGERYELLYREMQRANLVSETDFGATSRERKERKKWETMRF
jgi:ribosome maturation factor RimP